MKKLYIPLLLVFIIAAAFMQQGCDILNNLFLNQSLKQSIVATGSTNPITQSEMFCLSDYDAFNDNVDDIQGIKYLSAAYFTEKYSPSDLGATNITVTLRSTSDNEDIFTVNIPNASASNYINNPYKIELNANDIAKFNQYLAEFKTNDCYYAKLSLNATGSGTEYSLTGRIEIVIEMEMKP